MTASFDSSLPAPAEPASPQATKLVLLCGGGVLVLAGVLAGGSFAFLASLVALALTGVALLGSRLVQWRVLMLIVLAVVFFVPARRIVLAIQLPFDAEPYRLVAAAVLVVWLIALLADPDVRLRKTPFDWPIGVFVAAILLSELANPRFVNLYGTNVVKSLSLTFSFVLLYYFATSVFFVREHAEFLVRILVVASALVALTALVESGTSYNAFDAVAQVPGLQFVPDVSATASSREGRLRAFASAEHPIALGALFAIVVPLSVYLCSRSLKWLPATGLLLAGAFVTVSRTPVVMLVVGLAAFAVLRPRQILGLIPLLLVAACVMYLVFPSIVGPTLSSFYPEGGLLGEQSTEVSQGGASSNSRLADLEPVFKDFSDRPFFGSGLGARPSVGVLTGTYLPDGRYGEALDNQWLAMLLQLGLLGVFALAWLVVRPTRMLVRVARSRFGKDGWLAASLAASVASFGVGMLFFDAFAFVQVVIVFFFVLATAAVFIRTLPVAIDVEVDTDPAWSRARVTSQLRRITQYSATQTGSGAR